MGEGETRARRGGKGGTRLNCASSPALSLNSAGAGADASISRARGGAPAWSLVMSSAAPVHALARRCDSVPSSRFIRRSVPTWFATANKPQLRESALPRWAVYPARPRPEDTHFLLHTADEMGRSATRLMQPHPPRVRSSNFDDHARTFNQARGYSQFNSGPRRLIDFFSVPR